MDISWTRFDVTLWLGCQCCTLDIGPWTYNFSLVFIKFIVIISVSLRMMKDENQPIKKTIVPSRRSIQAYQYSFRLKFRFWAFIYFSWTLRIPSRNFTLVYFPFLSLNLFHFHFHLFLDFNKLRSFTSSESLQS